MQNLTSLFPNFSAFCEKILITKEIFLAISIFTVIWYTWILLRYTRKHRYPLPPGPRGLPLVGSLPFLDSELHSHFAKLAVSYGPIFSLKLGGKLSVVISSPALAREVLKQNDVVFANRDIPVVVTAMEYGGRDIVFTPHGPEWRMLRKVCVRDMLGHTTLDAFYGYRRQEVRNIVKHLHGLIKGSPVNVGELMFTGVLNVITSMLWGGVIGGDEGADVGAEFREIVGEITELLGKPNVSDFFPALAWIDLQGIKKKMKEVVVKLERVFEKIIEEKMEGRRGANGGNLGRASNFLEVLLQLKEEGDTEIPLTMMHIKALLLDMVVGGTDTTYGTVEFALAEMMNKPEVMHKAQRELDAVVGTNRAVEESDTNKLPYLNAVVKEVLRLHPALPLMVPHCPSKPCVIGGYSVPKGTRTFVNVWAIHRDPKNWTNPSEFVPERFLNGDEGDWSNDFSYLPFGSGRRSCAGIAMADRIVLYALASLVHSFKWEMCEGEKLDLSEKFGIVLKKKVPLVAIPLPRLHDAEVYH